MRPWVIAGYLLVGEPSTAASLPASQVGDAGSSARIELPEASAPTTSPPRRRPADQPAIAGFDATAETTTPLASIEPTRPPPDPPVAAATAGTVPLPARPAGPSLEAALAAARRRAEVSAGPDARWVRRARRAAALPTLTASYDLRTDEGWRHDAEPGRADTLVRDAGASGVARIRATWELDRLVFNVDEVRASRAAMDHRDWQTSLSLEIARLYYARWRAIHELSLATDPAVAAPLQLELFELEAHLHVLTGLNWSAYR